jgi:hypothetical protein
MYHSVGLCRSGDLCEWGTGEGPGELDAYCVL